jgi:mRNA interferase MazF
VVIIQNNQLNKIHPSTIVCPITTNVQIKANILRVHLKKGDATLKEDYDILVDQIRTIDNKRFIKRLGVLPDLNADQFISNLRIVLDI